MLEKNGFRVIVSDKSGHFLQTLHQLFIVYLNDQWLHRVWILSRFQLFKKFVRQIMVPVCNALFLLLEPVWPKSDKLYLNTIILAEKI